MHLASETSPEAEAASFAVLMPMGNWQTVDGVMSGTLARLCAGSSAKGR